MLNRISRAWSSPAEGQSYRGHKKVTDKGSINVDREQKILKWINFFEKMFWATKRFASWSFFETKMEEIIFRLVFRTSEKVHVIPEFKVWRQKWNSGYENLFWCLEVKILCLFHWKSDLGSAWLSVRFYCNSNNQVFSPEQGNKDRKKVCGLMEPLVYLYLDVENSSRLGDEQFQFDKLRES